MLRRRSLTLLALATLTLGGCAVVSHVATGEAVIKDRLQVKVDKPWNQFETSLGERTPTWTQEGITVDALRFYVGIRDGQPLAEVSDAIDKGKLRSFRRSMGTKDLVDLFENLVVRDGSSFELVRAAPGNFAGAQGFHFEFTSIRKTDEVRLRGLGWGAVIDGELFAVTYTAPRLAFFDRHRPSAQAIAASARVRRN